MKPQNDTKIEKAKFLYEMCRVPVISLPPPALITTPYFTLRSNRHILAQSLSLRNCLLRIVRVDQTLHDDVKLKMALGPKIKEANSLKPNSLKLNSLKLKPNGGKAKKNGHEWMKREDMGPLSFR